MENRLISSRTSQFKVVFPTTLNANDSLFGGIAMQWMDEVAFITATRFTRQRMFTIYVDNITFSKLIPPNSIVEVIGMVEKVEALKVFILVDVYIESMFDSTREKAISGHFTFVCLNERNKPIKLK